MLRTEFTLDMTYFWKSEKLALVVVFSWMLPDFRINNFTSFIEFLWYWTLSWYFQSHATTKKHCTKGVIVNNYVAHCDYRQICPVTCGIDDLLFYLDYFCPKTLIKDKKVSLTYKIGLLAYISAHYDDGRGKIYISWKSVD